MTITSITRRDLLKTTANGAAAASLLAVGTSSSHGKIPTKGRIRVGVVGVGKRSLSHINVLASLPDRCQLTAMCDIVPAHAKAGVDAAGGNAIKVFTNHKELLDSGLCDAVVVATPNYTHKRIAVDALDAGLHVLCEKPMATTLADAQEMVDAVRKSRRVFSVGLQFRYLALYRKAQELVRSGMIGDLKYVWAEEFGGSDWRKLYDDPEVNARKNWRYYRRLSGGTLLEMACHGFDILSWIIDANPMRVAATGGTSVYGARETMDHASVIVDYEGGTKLTLGLCMFDTGVRKVETVLIGAKGMLVFTRGSKHVEVRRAERDDEHISVPAQAADNYGHHGTRELNIDFLDSIAAGRPPLANVNVGYSALRIPIAAQQAIRQRQVMEMSQF